MHFEDPCGQSFSGHKAHLFITNPMSIHKVSSLFLPRETIMQMFVISLVLTNPFLSLEILG